MHKVEDDDKQWPGQTNGRIFMEYILLLDAIIQKMNETKMDVAHVDIENVSDKEKELIKGMVDLHFKHINVADEFRLQLQMDFFQDFTGYKFPIAGK